MIRKLARSHFRQKVKTPGKFANVVDSMIGVAVAASVGDAPDPRYYR
jgi:hypothetical protein